MFKSIRSSRSYEQVVAQIEQLIREGQMQVGDRFPSERDLAKQFEISRVVVREAMRNLEARGIVKVRHGSGTFVGTLPDKSNIIATPLTLFLRLEKASFLDLLAVRNPLEVTAARLAAERVTDEDMAALQACVERLATIAGKGLNVEENYFTYSQQETQFHQLIARASHNVPLHILLDAIVAVVMTSRFEIIRATGDFQHFFARHGIERIHDEHLAVAQAITEHRPDEAARLMDEHVTRSYQFYATLQDLHDLVNTPAG